MASTTWITLNLPFVTPISSPASIGHSKAVSDIGHPELAPSSDAPLKEGNQRARLVVTEGDLPISTSISSTDGRPSSRSSSPAVPCSHHHLPSPSFPIKNVHHLSPATQSTISPNAVSGLGQALLPGVEPFSSAVDPRVRTRGSSISSMGEGLRGHAHTSCRSSGFEERRREVCNLDHHLDNNAHNHHRNSLPNPPRTFNSSDLSSSPSSSSLNAPSYHIPVRPLVSSLTPLRPASPPSTWSRQQHLIDIDGNPYSDAMFRWAPLSTSSFAPSPDQPSTRPPRSKLRKPYHPSHPFIAHPLQGHNLNTLPAQPSILRDSRYLDLTDSNASSDNTSPSSGRATVSAQRALSSRFDGRPSNIANSGGSADWSYPGGSSARRSRNMSVASSSTAPTSSLPMSDHYKSSPQSALANHHPQNLYRPPLPPLPSTSHIGHQNASRPLPGPLQSSASIHSTKVGSSRKLTKRRVPSSPSHPLVDRPLPPSPTAEVGDNLPRNEHPPTRRSRSILGIRIPMVTESSKKRRMSEYAEPHAHLPHVEPHGPLWTGSKPLLDPYAQPPGSSPTVYTPFSAATSPSPTSSPHAPHIAHKRTPSGTLSDLAFTGTTALSSSALAHLTSRLSLRDEHSPEKSGPGVYSSSPHDQQTVFDPYAQQQQISLDPLDDDSSEDGYTVGCAAALDVTSIFRRRSRHDSGKAFPKENGRTLHVSASATFVRAERHTPPQSQSHLRSRPIRSNWNENDGASMTMRRWTLAMTDVSDEVLVQELEKIRKEGRERERERKRSVIANGAMDGSESGHVRGRRGSRVGSPPNGASFVYGGPSVAVDSVAPRPKIAKFQIGDERRSAEGSDSDDEGPGGTEEYFDAEGEDPSTEDEEAGWKTARRALLCCRELVRTERTYQARLRQLLQGDVLYDPRYTSLPALVLTHLPPLLLASEAFLARLEDDPSAWGVSTALLACEEEIEGAFVGWCEVVGDLFVDSHSLSRASSEEKPTSPRKLVRKTTVSTSESSESRSRVGSTFGGRGRTRSVVSVTSSGSASVSHENAYRPRAASYYGSPNPNSPPPPLPTSPSIPPTRGHPYNPSGPYGMFTAALGTGLAYGLSPPMNGPMGLDVGSSKTVTVTQYNATANTSIGHTRSGSTTGLGRTFTAWTRRSFISASSSLPNGLPGLHLNGATSTSNGSAHGHGAAKEKKPTVRELAIQPTQRIMRYVLQYRDLLDHTPTISPSRALVERALESALRIAEKCDRAQNNTAFVQP